MSQVEGCGGRGLKIWDLQVEVLVEELREEEAKEDEGEHGDHHEQDPVILIRADDLGLHPLPWELIGRGRLLFLLLLLHIIITRPTT